MSGLTVILLCMIFAICITALLIGFREFVHSLWTNGADLGMYLIWLCSSFVIMLCSYILKL